MVSSDQIKELIARDIDVEHVIAELNGANINLVVVSQVFDGLNSVKKQQLVYGSLKDLIAKGDLHAVTMKLYTPLEWKQARHFI